METAISIDSKKALAAIALISLTALSLWPAFHSPAMPMDEGMVLVYPELLLKGRLPYRDYESVTGPGNIMILAGAYATFGTSIYVERAVGLAYRLLVLLSIFAITQRWNTLVAAGCAFIATVLLAPTDLWSNTWFAGFGFAVCTLALMANVDSSWRALAAGVSAGIALLSRCDLGPALIISVLPLVLLMNRRRKIFFLAALALTLTPLLWLVIAAGPTAVIRNIFLYPVFGLNPGRHLPIAAAPADLQSVFALHLCASAINLLAGVFLLWRDSRSPRSRLLLGAAILGFAFVHYAMERFDSGHVVNAAILSVSLVPLSIFVLMSALLQRIPKIYLAGIGILVVLLATHLFLPRFTRYFYRGLRVTAGISPARQASKIGEELEPGDQGFFITHNGRTFPFGFSYAAQDADKLLTELERVSLPGQRLLVGPADLRLTNYCDTYIYYMEPQLTPGTYHLEMNPGSANSPNSRLPADIVSADWVVLNRRYDFLSETNRSTRFGSFAPMLALRENFDPWSESGSYLLFRNKKLSNAVVAPP